MLLSLSHGLGRFMANLGSFGLNPLGSTWTSAAAQVQAEVSGELGGGFRCFHGPKFGTRLGVIRVFARSRGSSEAFC